MEVHCGKSDLIDDRLQFEQSQYSCSEMMMAVSFLIMPASSRARCKAGVTRPSSISILYFYSTVSLLSQGLSSATHVVSMSTVS